eukprot:1152415-Pelagomonas_calceolata.AAC.1
MHPLQVDARIVHKLDISVQEASGSTLKHTTMLESACIAVIKVGEKKSLHQPKKPRTIRKAPLPSKLARASPKLDDFKWMVSLLPTQAVTPCGFTRSHSCTVHCYSICSRGKPAPGAGSAPSPGAGSRPVQFKLTTYCAPNISLQLIHQVHLLPGQAVAPCNLS